MTIHFVFPKHGEKMGFYSWKCAKTKQSIPAYPDAGFERCYSEVVLVTPKRNYYGVYDGYGGIDGVDVYDVMAEIISGGKHTSRRYVFQNIKQISFLDDPESDFIVDLFHYETPLLGNMVCQPSRNDMSSRLLGLTLNQIQQHFDVEIYNLHLEAANQHIKIVLQTAYNGESFDELEPSEDCEFQGFFYDFIDEC